MRYSQTNKKAYAAMAVALLMSSLLLIGLFLQKGSAQAANLSYDTNRQNPYSWIRYSAYSTTNFDIDGRAFYCAQGAKNTPQSGRVTVQTHSDALENRYGSTKAWLIKKVLYYAPGGPGYEKHKDLWESRFEFSVNEDHRSLQIPGNRARVYAHEIISHLITGSFGKGVRPADRENFERHIVYTGSLGTIADEISKLNPDLENCVFGLVEGSSSVQDLVGIWSYEAKGNIKLQKQSADPEYTSELSDEYSLEGAVYELWPAEETKEHASFKREAKTDKQGIALFTDLPLQKRYKIQEKRPSKGFALDEQIYEIELDEELKIIKSTEPLDTPKKPPRGALSIKKEDLETAGIAQGKASLKDAEFIVLNLTDEQAQELIQDQQLPSNSEKLILNEANLQKIRAADLPSWTLKTNEQGRAWLDKDSFDTKQKQQGLAPGYIAIWEDKAPEGYLLNDEAALYKVELAPKNTTQVLKGQDLIVKNQVIKAPIRITKNLEYHQQGDAKTYYKKLAGIEFEISSLDRKLIERIKTNEQGIAQSSSLPYGSYQIKELKSDELKAKLAQEAILWDDSRLFHKNFEINEESFKNPQLLKFEALNYDLSFHIELLKLDEQGNKILGTAAYRLYDKDKRLLSWKDDNGVLQEDFYSKDGTIVFPHKLSPGIYYVKESKAPRFYALDPEFHEIEIKLEAGKDYSDKAQRSVSYSCSDKELKGKIQVYKEDTKTGQALSGAEFSIFAAQDIYSPQNKLIYKKDSLIEHIRTDEQGMAASSLLYMGAYYLKESLAPQGYLLDPTVHELYLSPEEAQGNTVIKNLKIGNTENNLIVVKRDRLSSIPLKDTEFLLQAYPLPINKVVATKGVKKVTSTSSRKARSLVRPKAEQEREYASSSAKPAATPTTKPNNEEGHKDKTSENEPLAISAYFSTAADSSSTNGLSTLDAEEISKALEHEDESMRLILCTDDAGAAYAQGLKPGYLYKLTEHRAPDGYLIDTESRNYYLVNPKGELIELDEDLSKPAVKSSALGLISCERSNLPKTQVSFSKKSITGSEELPGAKLALYQGEKLIEEWVSGNEAHIIKNLPAGSYTLVERQAPEGYCITEAINFDVLPSNEVQKVEMRDDYSKLKIQKIDAQTKKGLAGAELVLIHEDSGKEIKRWTSQTEAQYFEKLPFGRYRIKELSSPKGYIKAEDMIFDLNESAQLQELRFENKPEEPKEEKPKPVLPKTSDTRKALIACISILGFLGLASLLAGITLNYSDKKKPQ